MSENKTGNNPRHLWKLEVLWMSVAPLYSSTLFTHLCRALITRRCIVSSLIKTPQGCWGVLFYQVHNRSLLLLMAHFWTSTRVSAKNLTLRLCMAACSSHLVLCSRFKWSCSSTTSLPHFGFVEHIKRLCVRPLCCQERVCQYRQSRKVPLVLKRQDLFIVRWKKKKLCSNLLQHWKRSVCSVITTTHLRNAGTPSVFPLCSKNTYRVTTQWQGSSPRRARPCSYRRETDGEVTIYIPFFQGGWT